MGKRVMLLLGTNKGAFIVESNADRQDWHIRGPYCDGWVIHHVIADPQGGKLHAAGGNPWTGVGVWTSNDLGHSWSQGSSGFAYDDGEPKMKSVWSLASAHGRLYAGVEPAGLFVSEDGGGTFSHVSALRDHPTRADWVPGGGGLILHSLVTDPDDAGQIWVGISAAGVYHSADGGATWAPRNRGTRCDFMGTGPTYPDHGQCVHSVVRAPGKGRRLYQQNHCGMYRSDDGGTGWASMENGLPSDFGFPVAVHPRDPDTVYLVPLNGAVEGRYVPEGKAAVWRSRDGGASWQAMRQGLPQKNAYLCVLRQALATDTMDEAGVYFGTNSGSLFASTDEGETWDQIATHLPMIFSVETLVVEET